MNKTERRVRDFSSGMTNLGDDSRKYIQKLTNVLFFVEQPPVCPVIEKKFPELGNESECFTERK